MFHLYLFKYYTFIELFLLRSVRPEDISGTYWGLHGTFMGYLIFLGSEKTILSISLKGYLCKYFTYIELFLLRSVRPEDISGTY